MIAPIPVGADVVMRMLYEIGAGVAFRSYPSIALGISEASNQDPIFPGTRSGSEATVALLVAIAWEMSRFLPYSSANGRVGLYRLRPPVKPPTSFEALSNPRSASLFAIDIVRESFARCGSLPLEHRLSWMIDLGDAAGPPSAQVLRAHPTTLWKSERMISHSQAIFRRHFGEAKPDFSPSPPAEHRQLGPAVIDAEIV